MVSTGDLLQIGFNGPLCQAWRELRSLKLTVFADKRQTSANGGSRSIEVELRLRTWIGLEIDRDPDSGSDFDFDWSVNVCGVGSRPLRLKPHFA